MPKREKAQIGVADAAEYLYAIYDEFRGLDETAQTLIREARTLLDVAVARGFDAHQRNAVVLRVREEAERTKKRRARR